MKYRPLIFSRAMVIADREGRKSQTRRLVQVQPNVDETAQWTFCVSSSERNAISVWSCAVLDANGKKYTTRGRERVVAALKCPYGQSGDILYIKEAAWIWCRRTRDGVTASGRPKYRYTPVGRHAVYAADHPVGYRPTTRIDNDPTHMWRLKTARYLPRWAVRSWRQIVEVRVERVQEISGKDAASEGVELMRWKTKVHPDIDMGLEWDNHVLRELFRRLWDFINPDPAHCWAANPWVWAITYAPFTPSDFFDAARQAEAAARFEEATP